MPTRSSLVMTTGWAFKSTAFCRRWRASLMLMLVTRGTRTSEPSDRTSVTGPPAGKVAGAIGVCASTVPPASAAARYDRCKVKSFSRARASSKVLTHHIRHCKRSCGGRDRRWQRRIGCPRCDIDNRRRIATQSRRACALAIRRRELIAQGPLREQCGRDAEEGQHDNQQCGLFYQLHAKK